MAERTAARPRANAASLLLQRARGAAAPSPAGAGQRGDPSAGEAIRQGVSTFVAEMAAGQRVGVLREVPVGQLEEDPHNARQHFDPEALEELAASLKARGVIQPLIVRPGVGEGRYVVVAGHRRLRAAKLARLRTVPCVVRDGEHPRGTQLVENLQREDLTPVEVCRGILELMAEEGVDDKGAARLLGWHERKVRRHLQLRHAPEPLLRALGPGLPAARGEGARRLDFVAALEVLKAYHQWEKEQGQDKALAHTARLLERALGEGWSFRRVEAEVAQVTAPARQAPEKASRPAPLFEEAPGRLVVHLARLGSAPAEERRRLAARLKGLLDKLG